MSLIIHPTRRGFILGLASTLIAAPAIVHASNIMKVRSFQRIVEEDGWRTEDGFGIGISGLNRNVIVRGRDEYGFDIEERIPVSQFFSSRIRANASGAVWGMGPAFSTPREDWVIGQVYGYGSAEHAAARAVWHDHIKEAYGEDVVVRSTPRWIETLAPELPPGNV